MAARSVWVHDVDRAALVLGSSQRDGVVDVEAAQRAEVDVVRRRSGGGAVLLVPGDVVWVDVIVPVGDPLWDADVGRSMWWLGDVWNTVVGGDTDVHRGPLQTNEWSSLVCFAGLGPGEVTVAGRKAVGLSQRIAHTRVLQVERVVARQRQQVEPQRCQCVERFGRREEPSAILNRLARFGDGGFQVREHHVAVQQSLHHGQGRRFRGPEIRADHRLARQHDRDRRRLRGHDDHDCAHRGDEHSDCRLFH